MNRIGLLRCTCFVRHKKTLISFCQDTTQIECDDRKGANLAAVTYLLRSILTQLDRTRHIREHHKTKLHMSAAASTTNSRKHLAASLTNYEIQFY